jgi:hypothetical protein
MHRALIAAAVSIALAGVMLLSSCAGVAPATMVTPSSPTAEPSAPEPTAEPSAPEPTAEPTPTPESTRTADDEQIASIMKDATADLLDLVGSDFGRMSDSEIGRTFERLGDLAERTQTKLALYDASPCTASALATYVAGLETLAKASQEFLVWMATGAEGDAPGDFAGGAERIGTGVASLGCR